jgi:hypothetical protein
MSMKNWQHDVGGGTLCLLRIECCVNWENKKHYRKKFIICFTHKSKTYAIELRRALTLEIMPLEV